MSKIGVFAPCINEEELIEPKIKWALRHGFDVSITEGHHPHYKNHDENGLSTDKTTEILKSYSDRIKYTPIGDVPRQKYLRDIAYKKLDRDLDIALMLDIDEFLSDEDLDKIKMYFKEDDSLVLVVTDSLIFLDKDHCAPHIRRKQQKIKFNDDVEIYTGQFHERVFRYNKYYGYDISPFLVNDLYNRFLFTDLTYYNRRVLDTDIKILHYKNFKKQEAKKRHEMYKDRGDSEDYDDERVKLNEKKFKFEGNHPPEIEGIL